MAVPEQPGGAYAVALTSIGLLPNEAGAAAQIMLAPFGRGRRPGPRKARTRDQFRSSPMSTPPHCSDLGSYSDRAGTPRPDTPARHAPSRSPRDRVYMPAAGTG